MKGNNVLELNEATLVIALQFWLESQFRDGLAPQVVAVNYDNRYPGTGIFKVEITSDETP